ncbi:phospholipase DDHD1-like isoform X1 [Acipenser ruthenus]|uniref:phospholipase DDHD1-like isoform X1 n=1 Tax=Acipenser ruthenus TaxID=7906 RepID=UPI00145AD82E|nr:phospholipase DDHD1-like isoform X1 [Acipenser ruthenus]
MSNYPDRASLISAESPDKSSPSAGGSDWDLGNDVFVCCYEEPMDGERIHGGMHSVQSGLDHHLLSLRSRHRSAEDGMVLGLVEETYSSFHHSDSDTGLDYLHTGEQDYESDAGLAPPFDTRKRTRSSSSRHRYEVVTELGPEEVRWFYKEDKKTWKPFVGYDSLNIEVMYRKFCELNPEQARRPGTRDTEEGNGVAKEVGASPGGEEGANVGGSRQGSLEKRNSEDGGRGTEEKGEAARDPDLISINFEPVCVRGGLYEVDVKDKDCYPVYWNQQDRIPVMRGQWFIDGTWLPLEEDESDLIEEEHLNCFRGQQVQDSFDTDVVAKTIDSNDVFSHLPPFYLPFLFKWRGYQPSADTACHKRKRCEAIHSLKLSRSHVDWHSVDEVYLYSDATTSKIARTVTQKLGFSKASSSGTRLHRGYVEEASLEDKAPQATHIVFVVHGIGQKMDQGRIIKNTGMMRDAARKMEEKHFSEYASEHVEFLPVEWRSKLFLDGDTVDSITPDKVRGLRDMLNSSAMDIMYYTSPLYRDEITKGLTLELNRLYSLFCSRNPDFEEKGGKVSIVSHSLGCVITFDIMTGWDPVRMYQQVERDLKETDMRWLSYEERHLLEELHLTKQRVREIEEQLHRVENSSATASPALKFKVENFFCMGSPLAVFLALRGIRPGNNGSQDHFLPKSICRRLLNIFHPTDPVAYRLEPLILKHYSNISPVQIHWFNTTNPNGYEQVRPTLLNPVKEATSASDTESIPSPSTSPVLARRHYGESITNLGKASILGAASIGKGIGGIFFSRFGRSSASIAADGSGTELEDKRPLESQTSCTLSSTSQSQSNPSSIDNTLELESRIDFELREGMVESRYWSAVTSHTSYWSSLDVALFLLTFMYTKEQPDPSEDDPDPV